MTQFNYKKQSTAGLALSVSMVALVWSGAASAQESRPADAADKDVIIVTATVRAMSVQEAPISINAVSGEDLETNIVLDVFSLADQTPSLVVTETPFQPVVAIRGIGSTGASRGYEQSAPFFVDGVFGGRAGQFLAPFFDLDRIELVKGPQAIFFGKNATAGAVGIHSARPTKDFEGSINTGYEIENQGYFAEGVLSGPLSETVSARLAVRSSRQGAYIENTDANKPDPDTDDFAIRGSLTWEPNADVSIYTKLEYAERKVDGRREQLYCANSDFDTISDFFGDTVECVEDNRNSSGVSSGPLAAFDDEFANNESLNGAFNIDWFLGDFTLQSRTGYSGYNIDQSISPDFSALSLSTGLAREDFDQFTQEFRLISPSGKPLEYIMGGLYMDQVHDSDDIGAQLLPPDIGLLTGLTAPFGLPPTATFVGPTGFQLPVYNDFREITQDTEAWSAFFKVTYNITDEFRVSGGARYTDEKKDYNATVSRFFGPSAAGGTFEMLDTSLAAGRVNIQPSAEPLRRKEETFDPSVTVEWQPNRDFLAYATYAKGTKAGGFLFTPSTLLNFPRPRTGIEYDEEKIEDFEIGFKSTLADGAVQLNAAAFSYNVDGLQVSLFNPGVLSFETLNVDGSIDGLEIDGKWNLGGGVDLGGSLTLLDSSVDDFVNPFNPAQNLGGNPFPFAPDFAATIYGQYAHQIDDHLLTTRLQVQHSSSFSFDVLNAPQDGQDKYTTADLRVGFGPADQNWDISINVKNLTNEDDIRLFGNPSALSFNPQFAAQDPRLSILAPGRETFIALRKSF